MRAEPSMYVRDDEIAKTNWTEIEREKWELPIRSATLGYLGGLNRKSTDVANGTKLTEGVGVVVKSGFAVREQLRENRPTLAGTILKKVS